MPHQDIVIVVAQPPPESVPLPGEPEPITSTTSGAEEPQQSDAATVTTFTWASPPTLIETQNTEITDMGRNLALAVAISSTVAAALILAITYRLTLGRR